MKIIIIDNYDSFTYNLAQLFSRYSLDVRVYRNDEIDTNDIQSMNPDYICISPGPKTPDDAGISGDVVRRFGTRVPILGVCLGMQVINEVFGGITVRADNPLHGKVSTINHSSDGIFSNIPSPFKAARYHSLKIETNSNHLEILAHSDDGVIMGIQHMSFPICGVQFHPESFMTQYGDIIIENFLMLKPVLVDYSEENISIHQ
ncbi:aminodeoxychorismate/anthranilate synthase component II [bacterium]|nr:aminodeoxychorismate/anthranilate synthase component II [bacterium]